MKKQAFAGIITVCSLLCALALAGCGAESAEDAISEEIAALISSELTERGFSQAYLDCLSASALEAISQDAEAEFDGAVITVYDTQGSAASYAGDSEELGAALDKAALVLALGTARGADGSVLVTYSYQWLQPPEERWADAIGVTWDSAYLEMEDKSFVKAGEYTSDDKRTTTSEEAAYATGAPSGVVWFAALPSGDADTLSGCGSFTLLPKQANFTVTLRACYAHALTADTLSLVITPDGPQKQGDAEIIAVDSVLTYMYD